MSASGVPPRLQTSDAALGKESPSLKLLKLLKLGPLTPNLLAPCFQPCTGQLHINTVSCTGQASLFAWGTSLSL